MRPWETLDRRTTDRGVIELRRRGERDYLLTVAGRVVMTSAAHRSELLLAQLAVSELSVARPQVLVAGLGLGFTLRAALDRLPPRARVTVVELLAPVIEWCRGPLASLSRDALADPRVRVVEGDVTRELETAVGRYHAIALDLFEGPRGKHDPVLGVAGLGRIRRALAPGGVLTVWSEKPERDFERAMTRQGFAFECHRGGRGGLRHVVYRARPDAIRSQREASSRAGGATER